MSASRDLPWHIIFKWHVPPLAAPPTLCSGSEACGLPIWPAERNTPQTLLLLSNNRPAHHAVHASTSSSKQRGWLTAVAICIYIVWGHTLDRVRRDQGRGGQRKTERSGQTAVIIKTDPRLVISSHASLRCTAAPLSLCIGTRRRAYRGGVTIHTRRPVSALHATVTKMQVWNAV